MAEGLRAAGDTVNVWCGEFEGFSSVGMSKVGALIDASPYPRRLLVQWVPHGYGRRSVNVEFCRWLGGRTEPMDLMVHEAGFAFGEGGLRQHAAALVHRAMLALLLRKATRVWMASAAWERRLRPYLFGRELALEWLPVPSNIPVSPSGPDADYPVGYFGQYDRAGVKTVMNLLETIPDRIALIGRGAERVPMHERTIVIGETDAERLSRAIASCWVMCNHYVDGVSGRRGTMMASLCHGRAIATVEGRLSEPVWRESQAVVLSPAGDASALALNIRALLRDHDRRALLQKAALKFYRERFDLSHTIRRLMS